MFFKGTIYKIKKKEDVWNLLEMKKRIGIVCVLAALMLSACTQKEKVFNAPEGQSTKEFSKLQEETEDSLEDEELHFVDKTATVMQEDGWLYYLTVIKYDDGKVKYEFDGIQMWEKTVENCYIPVLDEAGRQVDKTNAGVPHLQHIESVREEMNAIYACLDDCQTREEVMEQLGKMELKELEKRGITLSLIEELFDKLDQMEYPTEYLVEAYAEIPYTDKWIADIDSETEVSVTYLTGFGTIDAIEIELLDKEGRPYSILSREGKLDKEKEKTKQVLDEMEKDIVKTQSTDISKYKEQVEPSVYYCVENLLKGFEED